MSMIMKRQKLNDRLFRSILACTAFALIFGGAAVASVPGVTWEATELELHPGPHDQRAPGRFTFFISGDLPVTVERIHVPCATCSAELADPPGDGRFQPGSKGNIDVRASFGWGYDARHNIYVTIRRGDMTATEKLTVLVNATPYAALTPGFLHWRKGCDPPVHKKAVLEAKRTPHIHLADINQSGDADDFEVTVKTIEDGRLYEIHIRPLSTDKRAETDITVITDFPSRQDPLTYRLTAAVSQPALPPAPGRGLPGVFPAVTDTLFILILLSICVPAGTAAAIVLLRYLGKKRGKEA